MRVNVSTLKRHYSKGGISKMMIINIILVVLIIGAISTLFTVDEQSQLTTPSNPTVNAANTIPAGTLGPADTQSEIDALKKQLKLETTKLGTLREDKKRIDDIREAADSNTLELDTLEVEIDAAADKPAE